MPRRLPTSIGPPYSGGAGLLVQQIPPQAALAIFDTLTQLCRDQLGKPFLNERQVERWKVATTRLFVEGEIRRA